MHFYTNAHTVDDYSVIGFKKNCIKMKFTGNSEKMY